MLYQPPAVAASGLDVVQSPFFGGEFGVYLTTVPAVQVGLIFFNSVGNVTYTANAAASIAAGGKDLQVLALGANQALPTDPTVAVQLTGTNASGGTALTGLAIFAAPAWAKVQGPQFGRGIAYDVVPSVTNAKFASVTGASASGGSYGLKLGVYTMPETGDYTFIGCTTEIDFNTKSRMAKGVDCRMEADAFVKAGKTQPGELRIGSKLFSMRENMAAFNGLKCTAQLVGVKDGQLIGDRLVFTEYRPTVKPRLPDGDGEATLDTEGKFVEHGFFIAP